MIGYGFVALGGAFGSALRFALDRWITHLLGSALPWGTILINIGGCFVIGLCTALFAGTSAASTPIEIRQFVLVGSIAEDRLEGPADAARVDAATYRSEALPSSA